MGFISRPKRAGFKQRRREVALCCSRRRTMAAFACTVLVFLCVLPGTFLQNTETDFWFEPEILSILERTEDNVTLIYNGPNSTDSILLKVSSARSSVAMLSQDTFNLSAVSNNSLLVPVQAGHLGITTLDFEINSGETTVVRDYTVKVIRERPPVDSALTYILLPFLILNHFAMGTAVEWPLVVAVLKRPYGVAIGALSQFVFMPLLAFSYSMAFSLSDAYAIGVLLVGSSPGGGMSNILTFFMDADLPLSMTMTFVSTCLALGMMPLSLYIYGRAFGLDSIEVPFVTIITSLLSITAPKLLGILLRHKKPHIAQKVMKVIRPISLLCIITVVVLGVIVNLHVIYTPWQPIMATFLLPLSGFIIGFSLAKIFRLDNNRARTVSIETGVQNGTIAAAMIRLAFPQPEMDLSFAVSFLNSVFQVGIGVLAVTAYNIYRCRNPAAKEEKIINDDDEEDQSSSVVISDLKDQSSSVNGEAIINPVVISDTKEGDTQLTQL
ncbi:ileal sodium/bile acid cotransporter-like [Branchiostoma floridae x Branchiostoma japonicum]